MPGEKVDNYPIQGRLLISDEDLTRNLRFIQQRLGQVSEPQPETSPDGGQVERWSVEFAATLVQWSAVQAELRKGGILYTLYESPHLHSRVRRRNEREFETIAHASNWAMVYVAAILLWLGGMVYLALIRHSPLVCWHIGIGAFLLFIVVPAALGLWARLPSYRLRTFLNRLITRYRLRTFLAHLITRYRLGSSTQQIHAWLWLAREADHLAEYRLHQVRARLWFAIRADDLAEMERCLSEIVELDAEQRWARTALRDIKRRRTQPNLRPKKSAEQRDE